MKKIRLNRVLGVAAIFCVLCVLIVSCIRKEPSETSTETVENVDSESSISESTSETKQYKKAEMPTSPPKYIYKSDKSQKINHELTPVDILINDYEPWTEAYRSFFRNEIYQSYIDDFDENNELFYYYEKRDERWDNIAAMLIYMDDDEIPELVVFAEEVFLFFKYSPYSDNEVELISSYHCMEHDSHSMYYYPKKLLLGKYYMKTMGGFSVTTVIEYDSIDTDFETKCYKYGFDGSGVPLIDDEELFRKFDIGYREKTSEMPSFGDNWVMISFSNPNAYMIKQSEN